MNTKKYFITLFSFIIFSIYFTLSGVFVPFIASIPQSNGGFKTLSSQNDFYKMVDNFYDPDEFYNFRTDNQNINILANFYNTLNASSNFDVLTSFNQAIAVDIDNFNGDQRFYYNSDEFIDNSQSPTINIKALQLNQKAYQGCSRKKKMTVIYTKSLMYVWKVPCWSVCWGLERSIVLRVM